MGRTYLPPLSLSAFLVFNKVEAKQKSSAWGGGRAEEGSRALGAPSQMSIIPGQCSPGEDLLRGSQSLPCTPMPALCLMPDQPWTPRSIGEGGILFLITLCRLALFSPSAHPREQGTRQRCGRTLQALDDLAQRGCLEAGTPGPLPAQSRGRPVCQPHRPGPFQSPWH